MSIISKFKLLYSKLYMIYFINYILKIENQYLRKYNGSSNMYKDPVKLENFIRIKIHGIEKGFSYRNVKPSFGKDKIMSLLLCLEEYFKMENHNGVFAVECIETINDYINRFRCNNDIQQIINKFEEIRQRYTCENLMERPVTLTIHKKDIDAIVSNIDYESFLSSRHSYRYYTKEPVNPDLLRKALKISERSPSACNRQAQKVYVFTGEKKDKLLNVDSSRGFVSEIDTALLITVDMRAYFSNEFYQCYVDGGLYAMNLINAIHSVGLGSIPLTMSSYAVRLRKQLCESLEIPLNEAPIIAIGVGNIEQTAQVNASYRKDYNSYTTWM